MIEQQKLNELAFQTIQKTNLSKTLKEEILPLYIHPITSTSDTTYFFKHFLDFTPLNNPVALHHFAFARSLNQYCNQLYKAYPKQFAMEFADQIMGRIGENEEVVQYINTYLLDKMVDYKTEEGLSYFLENYVDGCSSQSAFSLSTKNLIQSLKNCEPGKRALELNYPNKSGELTSLLATCKKNKITLVMFWRSNCSHCEEFHPVLEEIYKKYHPKGLEVYAISIDKEQAPWLNFLEKHPYPWIEVYAPNEQRTKLSNNYPAPSTPTIIALDSKGRVISRLIMRSKLENFLEENSSYFQ
jgi:thiol-disulfide isomerase/thioredoxin